MDIRHKQLSCIDSLRAGCAMLSVAMFAALPNLGAATLGWPDGVNVQAGYFNEADKGNIPIGWDLMKKFDRIGTVRIEIPPEQGVRLETMQGWIADANAHGFNVIATYHDYRGNGSDDPGQLLAAARWWRDNYAALAEAGPFTLNLMNEWGGHSLSPEQYADAYNKAIAIVREVYSGTIIVDIPGWAQETVTAAKASPLIEDSDIVFSVHIYSSAYVEQGPRRWMQPEDLVEFAKVDRPIIIGEFGGMREGGADWAALTDTARALGWTVLAWAWNGDGEGMNMVMPSWNDEHSPEAYYPSTYFAQVYARIGNAGASQMTLSVGESIRLGSWPSRYTFAIHGNCSWSIECDADWILGLSPLSGWGTEAISFQVPEYNGQNRREATITVRGEGIVRSFPVIQDAPAKAQSVELADETRE
ncbi:MAG: cellulase family glycosylhydrolase [Opitutales bacterium]|nr:cellulase family glycosylhydrolase [Opitutales bacterium]